MFFTNRLFLTLSCLFFWLTSTFSLEIPIDICAQNCTQPTTVSFQLSDYTEHYSDEVCKFCESYDIRNPNCNMLKDVVRDKIGYTTSELLYIAKKQVHFIRSFIE